MIRDSRKGSASAVVVLLTVFLAVFGVLALVSSYSGLKLASRHKNWSIEYYRIDAQAEQTLAQIEKDLKAAARQAGSISADGEYPRLAIAALISRIPADRLSIVQEDEGLTAVIQVGPGMGAKDVQSIRITIEVDFTSGTVPDRMTRVIGWRQWQKPFEYKEGSGDLWEGIA